MTCRSRCQRSFIVGGLRERILSDEFVVWPFLSFQPSIRSSVNAATSVRSNTVALDMVKHTVVLVRHGESTWNNENKFTGWVDCPLSEKGEGEAREAGRLLKEAGFTFDVAYTSTLKRAIKTLWNVLEELDLMYIPIVSILVATSMPTPNAERRRSCRWLVMTIYS